MATVKSLVSAVAVATLIQLSMFAVTTDEFLLELGLAWQEDPLRVLLTFGGPAVLIIGSWLFIRFFAERDDDSYQRMEPVRRANGLVHTESMEKAGCAVRLDEGLRRLGWVCALLAAVIGVAGAISESYEDSFVEVTTLAVKYGGLSFVGTFVFFIAVRWIIRGFAGRPD